MTQVISIVGPTASGKTALSISLAHQLDAEIVSLDAYQVYRGMDIGTAKPTVAERAGIPHHLIDVVDIHDSASVADFRVLADAAIANINRRGRIAICVGGSGLYVRACWMNLNFRKPIQRCVRNTSSCWKRWARSNFTVSWQHSTPLPHR